MSQFVVGENAEYKVNRPSRVHCVGRLGALNSCKARSLPGADNESRCNVGVPPVRVDVNTRSSVAGAHVG